MCHGGRGPRTSVTNDGPRPDIDQSAQVLMWEFPRAGCVTAAPPQPKEAPRKGFWKYEPTCGREEGKTRQQAGGCGHIRAAARPQGLRARGLRREGGSRSRSGRGCSTAP